jgi:hypothetical protein
MRWPLTLVVFFVALGCDGQAPRDADGGRDGSVSADAGMDAGVNGGSLDALADVWCPVVAARFCAAATRCGCEAVPGFDGEPCLARTERGCRDQLARFAEPVASGVLVPAPRVPDGCEAALEAALAACRMPEPDVLTVACPLVWPRDASRALPGPGAACFDGLCAEGARCSSAGTCATPTPGGTCERAEDCPADERCDGGRCRAWALDTPGGACSGPSDCAGDLSCLASPERACRPRVATGPCASDDECVEGAFCDEGACAPAPGLGAPCGGGVACASGLGCRFAPGEGEGTCQPLPGAGEPCALGREGPFLCAAGLACRARVCGAIPGEGEACAVGDVRCGDGLVCHVEGVDSVCRPPAAEGASCMLDESCADGLYCDFRGGRCARVLDPGSACTDGNECGADGACVPDPMGAFRCVARPALGEACFLDGSCLDGFACRSVHDAGACARPMCAAYGI